MPLYGRFTRSILIDLQPLEEEKEKLRQQFKREDAFRLKILKIFLLSFLILVLIFSFGCKNQETVPMFFKHLVVDEIIYVSGTPHQVVSWDESANWIKDKTILLKNPNGRQVNISVLNIDKDEFNRIRSGISIFPEDLEIEK